MQTRLKGKDLITTQDWTFEEIETALDVAWDLKRSRALGLQTDYLLRKTLFMLFFFTSTRTRNSFEAGMTQLGGHAHFIESSTTQISHGDTPKEIGKILGSYGDGIAIRHCDWGQGNRYINEVAQYSPAPVLNMQCEIYHPFQIMADLMTIVEKKGRNLEGKKIAVSWAYAASYQKPLSVPQSLILLAARFGMDVTLAYPPEFKLMPEIEQLAADNARKAGGSFEIVHDMDEAFKGADVVYPKSWGCMLTTEDLQESARISQKYTGWITDARRIKLAQEDVIYMHPLPADREIEVTNEVIDGPHSVVYDQAENRLHAQKAIMALTM
ncbi:MAG: ornithine carbamoyltransferase [Anaerolineae bacterium]|nr:ornithine carbamoyltransferase [Anaerolineae bacterium]